MDSIDIEQSCSTNTSTDKTMTLDKKEDYNSNSSNCTSTGNPVEKLPKAPMLDSSSIDIDTFQKDEEYDDDSQSHHYSETGGFSNMSVTSFSSENDGDDDDDDEYLVTYFLQLKRLQFLMSSSSSLSSLSSGDDPSQFELRGILSDLSSEYDLYNDWDHGLNSIDDEAFSTRSSEEGGDVNNEESLFENNLDIDLPFPHRAKHLMECQICLEMSILRRRVCCDYQVCNTCLSTYLTMKVTEGNVLIECPNDRCHALVYKDEIHFRLSNAMREKFNKFLIDANADPFVKTCPCCSSPYEIDPELLKVNKKKLKYGVKVICDYCKFEWCFKCHAPFHTSISCAKFKKGDDLVKQWAKRKDQGQANAQRCPKCKVFIQRKDGCDHMQCSQCGTNFCYRCGDRYISIKFLGNHWSKYSLFGCKYRLLPLKPGLRRFIRGTNFGARLMGAVVLAGLGAAAGAVLLGAGVFILPGYGIVRLRRSIWARRKRKIFLRNKMLMLAAAQKWSDIANGHADTTDNQDHMTTIPEESETEFSNPMADPQQQIQVLVHRSVSFNKEETTTVVEEHSKNVLVNRYISDGSEVFVSRAVDERRCKVGREDQVGVEEDGGFLMVADVQEVKNDNGYSTVVCNIVSRVGPQAQTAGGNDRDITTSTTSSTTSTTGSTSDVVFNSLGNSTKDSDQASHIEASSCNVDRHSNETLPDCNLIHDQRVSDSNSTQHFSTLTLEQDESNSNMKIHDVINEQTSIAPQPNAFCVDDCSIEEKVSDKKSVISKELASKVKIDKVKDKEGKIKIRDAMKVKTNPLKIPVSDINSAEKSSESNSNGCFAYIFSSSKRPESPTIDDNNSEFLLHQSGSKALKLKDPVKRKAATWEKCRKMRSDVEIKASESQTDVRHLHSFLQKSPSSISSIITFNYKADGDDRTDTSDSFIPVCGLKDSLSELNLKQSDVDVQLDDSFDTLIGSDYVSKMNCVTHL